MNHLDKSKVLLCLVDDSELLEYYKTKLKNQGNCFDFSSCERCDYQYHRCGYGVGSATFSNHRVSRGNRHHPYSHIITSDDKLIQFLLLEFYCSDMKARNLIGCSD